MAGKLAVVGAGLMGSGIAQVAAQAGWQVSVRDVDEASLARGLAAIRSSYDRLVAKGKLSAVEAEAALDRITPTTDLKAAAAEAEIVVEAVFESIDVKRDVFMALDGICRPDAVLATNTSAIPITAIAAFTERPEAVVGTHFFSPVPMMALCELVRGQHTSDATLTRAREFAESVGKTAIVVGDVAGFVTTRLIVALANEAARLVESGVASAEDIDTACRLGFGHAMGPLRTMDLTGIDVMVHASNNIYADTHDAKFSPPESLLRMVRAGVLGRKTGQGFYRYD